MVVQETTVSQQLGKSQGQTARKLMGDQFQCCGGAQHRHHSQPESNGCREGTEPHRLHHSQALQHVVQYSKIRNTKYYES